MELGLAGKTALITGGSKGIGFGVAEALAGEGCHVRLVARSADRLKSARDDLEARFKVSVETEACDITQPGAVAGLLEDRPLPDILVNNAGAIPAGTLTGLDEPAWRAAWELKVFGYINMSRAFYGRMAERGHGVICNITGLAGDVPDFDYIAGTTGNAGLNAFTKALGGRGMDEGVRVFGVSPGPVQTERLVGILKARSEQDTGSPDGWRDYMAPMPLSRAAHVREVADLVAFLVSERGSYISGTVYTVDGGQSARSGNFRK